MKTKDIIIRLKQMGYVGAEFGDRTIVNITSKVPKKKDWPDMLAIWHIIVCRTRAGKYGITMQVDRMGRPCSPTFDSKQWRTDGRERSSYIELD